MFSGTALLLIQGFALPVLFSFPLFPAFGVVGVGKVEVVVSHIRVIVDSFLFADSCSCFVSYGVISVILHLMGNHTFRTARGVTLIDPI